MMNWPFVASVRACATMGSAASASETSNTVPNTLFMATKAAAMPLAVWRNRRRSMPSLVP